jgi:putative transposase
MKKSRFSDEQIVKILSSITDGVTVREVCQNHGVSENTFYTWKRKYAGMESEDIRKLKDLQSGLCNILSVNCPLSFNLRAVCRLLS